jgi:hypothetical protein
MRIKVKTNFGVQGLTSGDVDTPGKPSLRDLLSDLSSRAEYPFLYPDGQVDSDVEITLNGLGYAFLPAKLDTPLKEEDSIEIAWMAMTGG